MNSPANDGIRPFCVPITQPFTELCATAVRRFRSLADESLGLPGKDVDCVFWREVEVLEQRAAAGDPGAEEQRFLHSMATDAALLATAHAVDHVRALEHDITMAPPPVWSPLALARVALEGFALAHYLVDPSITLEQRLARGAGLVVTEHQHQKRAARAFGLDLAEVERSASATEARVAGAGAVARFNVNGKLIGHVVGAEYAPLDFAISTQAKALLPAWAIGSYPLLSGAAHGRPWMIARGRSENGQWQGEAATIMAAAMVVMGALHSGTTTLGGYLGADTTATLADMESTLTRFLQESLPYAFPQLP